MKIDTEKLVELRKEAQERLETLLYLESQVALKRVNEDSITFPGHLSDATLTKVAEDVCDAEVSKIIPLTLLSQKMVVF